MAEPESSHKLPSATLYLVLTMDPSPSADPSGFCHMPVMLTEILQIVDDVPSGVFVDLTLGGAGHSVAVLRARPDLKLHGFDRDHAALSASSARLDEFTDRALLHRCRFDEATTVLDHARVQEVSCFLMDLGVSSPQLDIGERGFSYSKTGPLDMRMDTDQHKTAADIVNGYSPGELVDVLRSYGDERHAGRIVEGILRARPVSTTTELAEIISESIPAAARRRSSGHPAKRTFQALRIEVNDELRILGQAIDSMMALLAPGGIGMTLSYHSGEDRIVKDRMRQAIDGDALPGMPAMSDYEWLFRGAQTATDAELERNPRARSARLRAIRKSRSN